MLTQATLTGIITAYNAKNPYPPGPAPIDVSLAAKIIAALNRGPLTRGSGVKIAKPTPLPPPAAPPALAERGHTAYVIRDSCNQYFILIKGNTSVREGESAQPGQIASGSTKKVKVHGGILIELNDTCDLRDSAEPYQSVVTFSSLSEYSIIHRGLETHTKFGALLKLLHDIPSYLLYTFKCIQFEDPITHLPRLILYQPKAGREFSIIRASMVLAWLVPTLQQRVDSAFSYLEGIQNILRKSLWPIDLKPENTGYREIAGMPTPILTPYDYLGAITFSIFKGNFKQILPLLKGLFTRPVDNGYREALKAVGYQPAELAKLSAMGFTDELFNVLVTQLIFELAHMIFLIFNPKIEFVIGALHNQLFGIPGTGLKIKIINKPGVFLCLGRPYLLFSFFEQYCDNKDFRCFIPVADFGNFLRKFRAELRSLPGVVLPPQFNDNDNWINEFHRLVHDFRASPPPVRNNIEVLTMSLL